MASNTLTWDSLKTSIYDYTRRLAENYKRYLVRDKKKASGKLISSVQPLEPITNSGSIEGRINIEDYWIYVENGRRPGKFPPPDAILDFVHEKNIQPYKQNGKLPTENQLAFLISRSISQNGIKAGNQMQEALSNTPTRVIEEAVNKDIEKNL